MGKREWYSIAFILVCIVVAIISMLPKKQSPTNKVHVERGVPILLIAGWKIDGTIHPVGQAAGSLINRDQGYITTAKHVIEKVESNSDFHLYAVIDGAHVPLEKLWVHKTADLAVVHFSEDKIPTRLPHPYVVSKKLLKADAYIEMHGFRRYTKDPRIGDCWEIQKKLFCKNYLPFSVYLADAPMSALSPGNDIYNLTLLTAVRGLSKDQSLPYDELFFDHHVSMLVPEGHEYKEYEGMSGGGLVDGFGFLRAVTSGGATDRTVILAVPASEIPDKYLPSPR